MDSELEKVGYFHRHTKLEEELTANSQRKIVLVGNPNVGKSVIFNSLSGVYVNVSNYPGTTVDITESKMGSDRLFDTPGIYGVGSFNDEERVARDIILDADIVVNVVNAIHLERDLFLTLQLIDMGFPMVLAVNFTDEMDKEGIEIDTDLLGDLLGIPVVRVCAVKKEGLAEVIQSIETAVSGHQDESLSQRLRNLLNQVGSQPEALMILEGDLDIAQRHGVSPLAEREDVYVKRRMRANKILEHVVKTSERRPIRELLGKAVLNPLTGIPILLGVLLVLYQVIGVWVAQDLVSFTEVEIGNRGYEQWVKGIFASDTPVDMEVSEIGIDLAGEEIVLQTRTYSFPAGTDQDPAKYKDFLTFSNNRNVSVSFQFYEKWVIILAGEFGVLTMTITYLLFLLLPLVIFFYLFMSIFEDSGYLPRLATLVDRLLTGIGLNGRAVIPIMLGFGCVTMATITTRLLTTSKEKTIAAAILNFVIPCSAQLAVIAALLATAGGAYVIYYILIMFVLLVLLGTFLNKFVPGTSSALLIDLPPIRVPRVDNVAQKTFIKTYSFMKEATPWFMVGALIVSVMQVTGLLDVWQNLFAPITENWLLLPREAATAFVMGIVRRDFGAAGFLNMNLTPAQILTGLVTLTLFVPCIASVLILFKERGSKQAVIIWVGTFVLAFLAGGLIAQIHGLF